MKRSISIIGFTTLFAIIFAWFAGCSQEEATGPDNSPPEIHRFRFDPEITTPGGTTKIVCECEDPDGDTLLFRWRALHGSVAEPINLDSVLWTAPDYVGLFGVELRVSNEYDTLFDTTYVPVGGGVAASITSPANNTITTFGEDITLSGLFAGYDKMRVASFVASFTSDLDDELTSYSLDTTSTLSYTGPLSYGNHQIVLNLTVETVSNSSDISATLTAADTITVRAIRPQPVTVYDIERNYTDNNVTWSPFSDPEHFVSYEVVRIRPATLDTVRFAPITDAASTSFRDTTIAIGATYAYSVRVTNAADLTAMSNSVSITSGVFTQVESSAIGTVEFIAASDYLVASLTDKDSLLVIDVTANNIDYTLPTGDAPFGLAHNSFNNVLYVANSGETTINVVDSRNWVVADTIEGLPNAPLYLSVQEMRDRIYATTLGNHYPMIITRPAFGDITINEFRDARLIFDRSSVYVDNEHDMLYLSEIGGFPASLYKYNITGETPQTPPVTSEHGGVGTNLMDLAILPQVSPYFDGNAVFVASESPYHVQILDPDTFDPLLAGGLPTGPYPNAVAVDHAGKVAYTSQSGSSILIWNLGDLSQEPREIAFTHPVVRGGISVSTNDNFVAVVTYDEVSGNSMIAMIYVPDESDE